MDFVSFVSHTPPLSPSSQTVSAIEVCSAVHQQWCPSFILLYFPLLFPSLILWVYFLMFKVNFHFLLFYINLISNLLDAKWLGSLSTEFQIYMLGNSDNCLGSDYVMVIAWKTLILSWQKVGVIQTVISHFVMTIAWSYT